MKPIRIKKIVLAALFAALIFISTYIVQIPIPNGYVNLGDCFVILSGIMLGSAGIASAAVGSALCDALGAYAMYTPATFIIKGAMALVVYIFTKRKYTVVLHIISAILAELIMIGGYLLFEWYFYGAGALASVPYNAVQGTVGMVASVILYAVLKKSGLVKRIKL